MKKRLRLLFLALLTAPAWLGAHAADVYRFPAGSPGWTEALRQFYSDLAPAYYPPMIQTLNVSGVTLDRFVREADQQRARADDAREMVDLRSRALGASLLRRAAESLETTGNGRTRREIQEDIDHVRAAYGPFLRSVGLEEKLAGAAAEMKKVPAGQSSEEVAARMREISESIGLRYPDTAVELETETTPAILSLLTTPDGTVGGLLAGKPVPDWMTQGGRMTEAEARAASFETLRPEEKLRLLQHVTSFKRTTFYQDRVIPNAALRKTVDMRFPAEASFLGKNYSAGTHAVDISPAVKGPVEYSRSIDVVNVAGVEFHFRTNQFSAGNVSMEATKLLLGIGHRRVSQHVYTVAPLPLEELMADPETYAALLGDFILRANYKWEMASVLAGRPIKKYRLSNGAVDFGSMDEPRILGIIQYFRDTARGIYRPIKDAYKMAWVGFRGADKFDQPGLYGLENRSIYRYSDESRNRITLDGEQRAQLLWNYGLSAEAMRRWLSGRSARAVAQTWYNRPWHEVVAAAPEPVRRMLKGFRARALAKRAETNQEVKFLIHDWSTLPIFQDNPAAAGHILSEQLRALSRITPWSVDEPSRIVREFIVRSMLDEHISRSLSGRSDLDPVPVPEALAANVDSGWSWRRLIRALTGRR